MSRFFIAAVLLSTCWRAEAAGSPAARVTVLAAASLSDVLPEIEKLWRARGHSPVSFSFAASSRLAGQAQAGFPADLFISADADWMDRLEDRGLLAPKTRRVLAGNRLVAVVLADSPISLAAPADWAAVTRLALADDNVPAGRYARSALEHFKLWERVRENVVRGDSVRMALSWVASGRVQAGIVYRTDAAAEPRVREAFVFPADSHPRIVYPGAVLKTSPHNEEARLFLDFCASPQARAVFARAGFIEP